MGICRSDQLKHTVWERKENKRNYLGINSLIKMGYEKYKSVMCGI